jgi:hypothetical protein
MHSKKGVKRQFMKGNPFSTDAWHHGEKCCHPHREGHLVLSLVLAYCLTEEEKFLLDHGDETKIHIEHDFTTDTEPPPRLRDPLYLSPDEEDFYVQNSVTVTHIDFTDPNGEDKWKELLVAKKGWSLYADNADKDKFGFIANDVSGNAHIAITITGGKMGLIELSYILSYENFGDSLAWIGESGPGISINTLHPLCDSKHFIGTGQRTDVDKLIGHWKEKASIPTVTILKQRIKEGEQRILHICLLPHLESREWKENKFKLLGIRVY